MRVDVHKIGSIAAAFLAAFIAGNAPLITLGELSIADAPVSPSVDKPAASIQSGAGLNACVAWTDGCVTCRRTNDAIACSNPGIACQPGVPRCLEAASKPEH